MQKMKKGLLFALVACLMLSMCLGITGCNKKQVDNSELVYVHSWTEEGLGGHYFSGANMGPVSWYVVEGLGDYLRTQDYVYYTTAESITHNADNTSVITLREGVKWQHTNKPFVAMDVVAFFYLNNMAVTKYITSLEATDDRHVTVNWNPAHTVTDEIKTLLLVSDRVACTPYDVFKEYADVAINIYNNAALASEDTMPFFGRELTADESLALAENYGKYQAHTPEYFPATGPYTIHNYDANEMLLTKNTDWYDAGKVGFEKIRLINSVGDASLFASMLINGDIDIWLNTPSKPVVENILASNKDIVFYKVSSPYAHGVKFNMQKADSVWSDKVREAMQYIFDREEIRALACYYAETSWTSMSGMTDTDMKQWMSEGAHNELESKYTYSYDWTKAETLLKEAGWSRKGGKWYGADGKLVELVIGYDGSNTVPSTVAEAVQAQLTNFGITASLKRASGYAEFYALSTQPDSPYDLVCDNTSYNASYNYPYACFQEFYTSGIGATANLKYLKDENLIGYKNQVFKPADYLDKMLTLQGAELTTAVDNLVLGVARENVGITMFQERSGGMYNSAKIAGLPFQDYVNQNRDVQYFPVGGTEDHIALLYTILFYDHGAALYNGMLYPAGK